MVLLMLFRKNCYMHAYLSETVLVGFLNSELAPFRSSEPSIGSWYVDQGAEWDHLFKNRGSVWPYLSVIMETNNCRCSKRKTEAAERRLRRSSTGRRRWLPPPASGRCSSPSLPPHSSRRPSARNGGCQTCRLRHRFGRHWGERSTFFQYSWH
jgi:hypothetical protein